LRVRAPDAAGHLAAVALPRALVGGMNVTMLFVEQTIEAEIKAGCKQSTAAMTYAWGLRNEIEGDKVDWPRMNRAILSRWPKGLERVKTAAQKWYREQFRVDWFTGEPA
jgi:hypothetical protein